MSYWSWTSHEVIIWIWVHKIVTSWMLSCHTLIPRWLRWLQSGKERVRNEMSNKEKRGMKRKLWTKREHPTLLVIWLDSWLKAGIHLRLNADVVVIFARHTLVCVLPCRMFFIVCVNTPDECACWPHFNMIVVVHCFISWQHSYKNSNRMETIMLFANAPQRLGWIRVHK